ncbi:MAG TPA: histidine--tRNA ligase [Acidimicrobiales bacterium]|nr:histidine--tRNA ligase [Acidimicrobiales bacterium]
MTTFQSPKGTQDILAPESARWIELVGRFAGWAQRFGFGLVMSPGFEDAQVFRRSAGESSDVVTKEMYEFTDRGGRDVALRPEGTASVVRAFVQHRPVAPFKAWYAAPMFRYERPQAGRFRQHHQLGVEILGTDDPVADVEVIALLAGLYAELGLSSLRLRVNSLGDKTCAPGYREQLLAFLAAHADELCSEHRYKWSANPLRILDCKRPECRAVRADAPRLRDAWCDDCRRAFEVVLGGLDRLGIAYEQDDFLVRGLDYYNRTTFEFGSDVLEGVGGGGRYDGLVAALGGPDVSGVGFGAGIERILLACDADGVLGASDLRLSPGLDAFVVDLTGAGIALELSHELRATGLAVDRAFDGRSGKAQLKAADRSGATVACIVGEEDLAAGLVTVRVLRGPEEHKQEKVPREGLASRISEITRPQ